MTNAREDVEALVREAANRCWRDHGEPLEAVAARARENMRASGVPLEAIDLKSLLILTATALTQSHAAGKREGLEAAAGVAREFGVPANAGGRIAMRIGEDIATAILALTASGFKLVPESRLRVLADVVQNGSAFSSKDAVVSYLLAEIDAMLTAAGAK